LELSPVRPPTKTGFVSAPDSTSRSSQYSNSSHSNSKFRNASILRPSVPSSSSAIKRKPSPHPSLADEISERKKRAENSSNAAISPIAMEKLHQLADYCEDR
jgi:hypothetical protein